MKEYQLNTRVSEEKKKKDTLIRISGKEFISWTIVEEMYTNW